MITDPISDMLTRIRNAARVKRPHVDIPASKLKTGLAEVLKREGYIWDWQVVEAEPSKQLRIELKYGANGEDVIQSIKSISTPGRRVYRKAKEMKPVLGGMGITIISTSRGIVSDREARQKNIGGEVLCEVS